MNLFLLKQLVRSIWFRPALYALASVFTIGLTPIVALFIPENWIGWINDGAVEQTLEILASSLLAVAIFALATMFQAFQAAAQAATPRARPLMTEDRTAQTAVSTFIGAFLFSLLALIGLSTGLYAEADLPVLFALTLILVGVVIYALIRWIQRLSGFGGVEQAILAIEGAACEAIRNDVRQPGLGGRSAIEPPPGAEPVAAECTGYVQSVDSHRLAGLIAGHDIRIHILARPGHFVGAGRPLACATGLTEEVADCIRDAFVVATERTFAEDPRFGLVALSEIASRALSPAVNDPGTAISVLAAHTRLFEKWTRLRSECDPVDPVDGLTAEPLDIGEALEDAFLGMARDGAGHVEVASRLQVVLAMLERTDADRYGEGVARLRERALDYARDRLGEGWEYDAVKSAAAT
jgi:uncharacterized membrane protein